MGESGSIPAAEPVPSGKLVEYAPGAIVSRTLVKSKGATLTAFAFDAGQSLSEHSAPFDAYVTVLDGAVELTIGGKPVRAQTGAIVLMQGNVPHAVDARERGKIMLTMIRG